MSMMEVDGDGDVLQFKEDTSDGQGDDVKLRYNLGGYPIPTELMYRELGFNCFNQKTKRRKFVVGKNLVSATLASTADYNLVACNKKLNTKSKFKLPAGARTTFHMAFSGDGKLVASCHGDHQIYVCEITSGKVIKTLSGHPRTPWCVVFHPTQSDILASGCLAGHVRVWDLKGGSELLITDSGTVISSIAFHPTVRLLAIGTFNEVLFWDWSKGDVPLARCCTENNKEKVRLVRFDASGHSLITGITNFPTAPLQNLCPLQTPVAQHPAINRPNINILRSALDLDLDPDLQEELEERQDRFQESYRQLVNHYEDLVQHYHTFLRSRIPRLLEANLPMSGINSPGIIEDVNRMLRIGEERFMNVGDARPGPSSRATSGFPFSHPNFPRDLPRMNNNNNNNNNSSQSEPSPLRPSQLSQQLFSVAANALAQSASTSSSTTTSQTAVNNNNDNNSSNNASQQQEESSTASSSSSTTSAAQTSSTPTAIPGPSTSSTSAAASRDFGSIEALAQNIMEMQNLCSQARQRVRLGPPTMETQHVMELQQIRQHLEVLQDQTRRLQHSIRATLSSLASGSLAAIRSQEGAGGNSNNTSTTNTASTSVSNHLNNATNPTPSATNSSPISSPTVNLIPQPTPPTAVVPPVNNDNDNNSSETVPQARPTASIPITSQPTDPSATPRVPSTSTFVFSTATPAPDPTLQEEHRPRRSISPSTSNSTSFFRISINSNPDRMRVPPVIRYSGDRRVVTREYVIDHHSRNCPFNLNQPSPAVSNRTRCLIEDEGEIELELWPTMDTGLETSTRSFPGVEIERREEPPIPASPADINLRVFLTVRGSEEGTEMSENWQRNFLSGLALVPSAVREGRRGRNIRFRRNYLRSQIPNRLNNSFVRSFYIRVDAELVPVYSSHETSSGQEIRDSLGSNVFIFPLSVFFNDLESSQQIGIYWPCLSQGEEEALSDVRRYEQPITVFPNQNAGMRRVRVSYDSNSLDIEVNGIRLGIVQPGVQILEAITNLRGAGTRGVIYLDYLAPLLEGMERYFSQQFLGQARGRRRQPRRIITFARDGQGPSSSTYEFRTGTSRLSQFHDVPSADDDNRRVLSLAVETAASAASELLINRRPVESRIERVLNSSTLMHHHHGQMGQSSSSSSSSPSTIFPSLSSLSSSGASGHTPMTNQERLDDIQRRISLLSNAAANSNWPGRTTVQGRSSSTQTTNPLVPREEGALRSLPQHHHWVIRRQRRFTNQPVQRPVDSGTSARTRASNQVGRGGAAGGVGDRNEEEEASLRFYQAYNPEILITPRATLNGSGSSTQHVPPPIAPPASSSYYHLDAATTSFLSSRVQKWDFSQFLVPDISQRSANVVVRECSLHSDACLDVSKNSEFLAVLQPSDSGAYSALGVYSLKNENLGDLLYVYHFDQNTVSVSVSPSSEYIVVGYAGRGPMYRFVQQGNTTGRNIGQVLSLRGKNGGTLTPIRDLYAENSGSVMAINCMHFLPVPGMGILYGTNTGELVLLQ